MALDEGPCPETDCDGRLELFRPFEAGDCRCHISPPCGSCISMRMMCPICGWEEKEEPSPVSEKAVAWWNQPRTWSKDLGDGKRVLDVDYDSRSGSTMVYTGRYEGPVTSADIFALLGDGTFGHRGPTLWADAPGATTGRFTYTKITD